MQRRFDYDRWGNRTGVWDATTGGNQIQNVALQQSGGAPTNRIQTVYPPKTNFALSANGSVASASSTYSSSYVASATINGDRKGTGWGEVGGGWSDATANSYPDWLQVTFNGSKTIDEIDVFTLQDNFSNPSEPTESMTFSQFGIVNSQVQYWNGLSWQTVSGGSITNNNKVWKKINFSQITTSKIRVNVTNALSSSSRITEVEAWGPGLGVNYVYDAAGNLTSDGSHTYTYDAANRLVSVDGGSTAQYAYDYQNQRVKAVSGGATTHYVWDGGHVIAEHDGAASGQWTTKVEYIYVRGSLIATQHYTVGQQYSTATRYYVRDVWSTRLVLDSSGNVIGRQGHLPFGQEFAETGTQEKHHFTTYEADSESGTDYAVNRQYSQSIGRFQSADPYQASEYKVNPQSWNRYAYVKNDPIHNVDPTGLFEGPPDIGMPDPCGGGDPIDAPSCSISARTHGKPLGRYQVTPRNPSYDPNNSKLGPITALFFNDQDHSTLPYFGFFFEVVVTKTDLPDSDWVYYQAAYAFDTITYRRADGSIVTRTLNPIIKDPDKIEEHDHTRLASDDEFHAWADAPGIAPPFPYNFRDDDGTIVPVLTISRKYNFVFSATHGNVTCNSFLQLNLVILNVDTRDRIARWLR